MKLLLILLLVALAAALYLLWRHSHHKARKLAAENANLTAQIKQANFQRQLLEQSLAEQQQIQQALHTKETEVDNAPDETLLARANNLFPGSN